MDEWRRSVENLTQESLARALWDTYRQASSDAVVLIRGKGFVPMPERFEDGPKHEQRAFMRQAKLLLERMMR